MAHDLSQKQVNFGISDVDKRRIKDSLLVIVVFIVGLLGSCYILHIALSQSSNSTSSSGYDVPDHGEQDEAIYVTGK
jgi:hypothetical protein